MQKPLNFNQILQQMPTLVPNFCDRCGAKHQKTDLEVVNQDMERIVCRVACSNCGTGYMIHINSPADGVVAAKKASYKSDISNSEIKKFSNTERIENEEILDVFIALKEVKTIKDFNYLFGAEAEKSGISE
jgi:hypothetical protein